MYHHNFADASQPVENANPVGLTLSPLGDVACAVRSKDEPDTNVSTLVRQSSSKYK